MLVSHFAPGGSALVTGASRGIGKVIALRFGTAGVPVAVNFRSSRDEADSVVREIMQQGGRAVALQADMADPEQADALVARAEEALGPLRILINNAGITRDRLVVQMSETDWAATWMTDLAGPRAAARAAVIRMTGGRGGRIVNIGSVVGATGSYGQANYAAAKSALMGITREMAVQCAPSNITVNCIVPGYIVTDATAHLNQEQQQSWLDRIPMGRYATASEVVDIVLFLASESAAYVTGQCIAVDGGFLARAGSNFAS